jgi:hypothetical protein
MVANYRADERGSVCAENRPDGGAKFTIRIAVA